MNNEFRRCSKCGKEANWYINSDYFCIDCHKLQVDMNFKKETEMLKFQEKVPIPPSPYQIGAKIRQFYDLMDNLILQLRQDQTDAKKELVDLKEEMEIRAIIISDLRAEYREIFEDVL